MFKRLLMLGSSLLCSSISYAFPCFLTLVKDSCWTDYSVTVTVKDATSNQNLLTVTAPKGQPWVRDTFVCQPNQKLFYSATFEPVFWEGSEGVVYSAIRYWILPNQITDKQKAWEIPICYPAAFASVPFPPKVGGDCQCNFANVPTIPLQSP